MPDFSKLAAQMRSDWDRRVQHDYRFWMSDGYESDEAMWKSGQRDFDIITAGVTGTESKTLLEVGCGVGRLLRPALERYQRVIGCDVSEKALAKARELLPEFSNLELHHGNGVDLQPLPDQSVDVVVSFAALSIMPTDVIASYLREMHRVLKLNGAVRLQVYLGEPHAVRSDDTLHLRCYSEQNFRNSVQAAGFDVSEVKELVLPFQVSFKEIGINACTATLVRTDRMPSSVTEISKLLLPEGEVGEGEPDGDPQELECWVTINYAKELLESGDITKAKEALEYASMYVRNATIDIRDLFDRIVSQVEKSEKQQAPVDTPPATKVTVATLPMTAIEQSPLSNPDLLQRNLKVLQEKFPDIYQFCLTWMNTGMRSDQVEVRDTPDGPVVYVEGQCLDHPTKPLAGGDTWFSRMQNETRYREAKHLVVFGLGAGYHIEAMRNATSALISVIEPIPQAFLAALRSRDLVSVFEHIEHLSVGSQSLPDIFGRDGTELLTRPQSQAVAPDYCGKIRGRFYGERGMAMLQPRIGVLGPLQGGTLPIAGYTSRVLREGGQRVYDLDVSGFAQGFHLLDNFVKNDVRQAIARNNYTEMISQLLLESIDEKPIDILICMAQAPISGRILTEIRQRGIITVLWFVEDFLRFRYWEQMAQFYDFIFTIQRGECLNAIKAAGAGEVHYLPTACDPLVHAPVTVNEEEKARWGSPISFVGAGYHNRQQTFASLANHPFKIWGTEWPECRPFDRLVQEKGRRLKPEEYVKIFNATDVNLNLHSSTERDGVDPNGDFLNPRTFELAACGAFQLVDHRSLLPEAFEIGTEMITFSNPHEMKEKIAYYLEHPEEREQVVRAARERVLREHTYHHRLREMLSVIYSSKFESLKRRNDDSPWNRMLRRAAPHDELNKRCEIAYQRGEEPALDGLVSDIVTGQGGLTETEQKLLFLFHVDKQILRMRAEESGRK